VITHINEIARQIDDDGRAWFPDLSDNKFFMAAAAAGEIGELINLLKKVERGTHTDEEVADEADKEAMDAIIYLLAFLHLDGQDIAALYEKIRENNVRRFGAPATTAGS
jgi:NTP pyrophosphatase (non-canonical NTP hydrolase)